MSELPPPDPSQRNLYAPEPPTGGEPASDDRLRRILVAVGGIAMVVFAIGLGLVVLRDDGAPDDSPGAPVASAAETSDGAATDASTDDATDDSTDDSTAPVTTALESSAPASGVPSSTIAAATTTTAATTATAPTNTTVATDSAARAVATAQALLDAFADGRWNDARTLNPGRNETDAFLQQAYGPIESATAIPAVVTPVNGGAYDVRFGIVAHENQPTGRQTVLMCSHWQVDVDAQTVQRLDSARIRVESGYIDPQARSSELSSVCATLPLR
jgi:hypothetical protein